VTRVPRAAAKVPIRFGANRSAKTWGSTPTGRISRLSNVPSRIRAARNSVPVNSRSLIANEVRAEPVRYRTSAREKPARVFVFVKIRRTAASSSPAVSTRAERHQVQRRPVLAPPRGSTCEP